ncbi:hypothetical protein SPLA10_PHROGS00178 [Salmonella phage SPLA10]|nr:hypothetical protein SPLA10_PHROGS00178 [Salmonella phage SPLA10]
MNKSKRIVQIEEGKFIEGMTKALQTRYPSLDKGNVEAIVAQQIGNHRVLNNVILTEKEHEKLLHDAGMDTSTETVAMAAQAVVDLTRKTRAPTSQEVLGVLLDSLRIKDKVKTDGVEINRATRLTIINEFLVYFLNTHFTISDKTTEILMTSTSVEKTMIVFKEAIERQFPDKPASYTQYYLPSIELLAKIADHLDPETDNKKNLNEMFNGFSPDEVPNAIIGYFESIASSYAAIAGSKSLVAVMSAFVGKMSEQSDTMFVQKFLTGKQYEAVNEVVNILRHELENAGVFSFTLEEFNKINNCMPHIGQKDLGISLSRSEEGDLMLQFNGVQNVSKL